MEESLKFVKLVHMKNAVEAGMLEEALKEARIASYRQSEGYADIGNIYSGGFSPYGVGIYVPQEDAEKAREILNHMGMDESTQEEEEREKHTKRKRSPLDQMWLGIAVFAFVMFLGYFILRFIGVFN